jgi:malate synthase
MAERHEDTRLLSELREPSSEEKALEDKRDRMTVQLFPWVQWCDSNWRRADTGRIVQKYLRGVSNARTLDELNTLWGSFNSFRQRLMQSRSE